MQHLVHGNVSALSGCDDNRPSCSGFSGALGLLSSKRLLSSLLLNAVCCAHTDLSGQPSSAACRAVASGAGARALHAVL